MVSVGTLDGTLDGIYDGWVGNDKGICEGNPEGMMVELEDG